MKITTKLLYSFFCILSLFIMLNIFVYLEVKKVNKFQKKSLSSELLLLEKTGLRGAVRNQVLDTFGFIYIDKKEKLLEDIKNNNEVIEKKFKKIIDITLKSYQLKTSSLQNEKKLKEDIYDINQVKVSYDSIYISINKALSYLHEKDLKKIKEIALNIKEEKFKKDFLLKISKIVEAEYKELDEDSENLENSISELQNKLIAFTLFAIFFTVIFTFFLSNTIVLRLRKLELATHKIANEDFQFSLPVSGSDEFSSLAIAFNHMSKSLQETKEKLIEQQKIIISASKMSALGEMAGGIAHEINNPLTIISGKTYRIKKMIEEEKINISLLKSCAESIELTTKRISNIIRGLLAFAKNDRNDYFSKEPLKEIIEQTILLCSEKLKNYGIDIYISEISEKLFVECQPIQISQVLLNLITNSFDAIIHTNEKKWIKIESLDLENLIEISVIDSGMGIPIALKDKVMEPFFTSKKNGHGTGLGLSISHGIIKNHNGELFLDHKCENTKFIIRLPKIQSKDIRKGE